MWICSFGFLQEFIEVFGHAHTFELNDAVIDSIGAIVGAVLGDMAIKRVLPG